MDLSTRIGEVTFKNPLIVTSGEHGRDGETIVEVAATGVAAVTTKSIVPFPLPDPLPCYSLVPNGFLNCVLAAVIPAQQWFEVEIPLARTAGVPIIANLAGTHPQETAELASRAVAAGADLVELPTHCPHLAENLEAQFPDAQIPPPELDNPGPFHETVKAVRAAVSVPIIGKLSAVFSHNNRDWVKAGVDAGMDAVEVTDTFGPVMAIDIETGQPKLGGPRGFGALSGGALKPIALRMVYEIAGDFDIPIIASGGVQGWEDAVEYFMAGASMVGVCTVGHLQGMGRYRRLIEDLERYFREKETTIEEIKGLAHRRVRERREKGWAAITKPQVPQLDPDKCTGCKKCVRSCIYGAITVNGTMSIDSRLCYGCGLCVEVCPEKALSSPYFKD
ncbi:MAG: 4Fe-4S binding protein [Spirochaetales bacterium]|nr:4Fe-4S binding protein [Spirochaetales bacterium]